MGYGIKLVLGFVVELDAKTLVTNLRVVVLNVMISIAHLRLRAPNARKAFFLFLYLFGHNFLAGCAFI